MVKHNNEVPNAHFHKQWQRRVKTWLDQAGRKKSRRLARKSKAARIAPRPTSGPLRPVVRCPTVKYNTKVRAGRGFTLAELKEAGITRREASSFGIAVDHRRHNRSADSLQANVERLKQYKARLVVFPIRRNTKPKAGDSSLEETSKAEQLTGDIIPIQQAKLVAEVVEVTEEMKNFKAFQATRKAQSDARLVGIRAKKAAEEAEKAKNKKK